MTSHKRVEEFQVGERTNLVIDVRSGTVEVRTGRAGRAVVTLDGDRADEWDIAQLGDSLSIDRHGSRAKAMRIFVEAPAGTDVEVKTVSADTTLGGVLGAARIHTVSGDVRIDSVSRLDIDSVSGDVRVIAVTGDASITAVSADIDVRDVGGRLSACTSSGDVRMATVGDDMTIGTASGDVRVERAGGSSIGVKCVSGDVTIGLPAGIRVQPDISTLSGRTSLPAPSGVAPPSTPRVVRVRLRTVSGNITIERVAS